MMELAVERMLEGGRLFVNLTSMPHPIRSAWTARALRVSRLLDEVVFGTLAVVLPQLFGSEVATRLLSFISPTAIAVTSLHRVPWTAQ